MMRRDERLERGGRRLLRRLGLRRRYDDVCSYVVAGLGRMLAEDGVAQVPSQPGSARTPGVYSESVGRHPCGLFHAGVGAIFHERPFISERHGASVACGGRLSA
ncbi:MAG: hypothetical protein ACK58T_48640, partial [Phycisphaerae bacterium]